MNRLKYVNMARLNIFFILLIGLIALTLILTTPIPTFAKGDTEDEGEPEHGFNWWQFIGKSINSVILFGALILLIRKPLIKLLAQKGRDIQTDLRYRENEVERTNYQLERVQRRLEKIEEEIVEMKQMAEKSGEAEKKHLEELGAKEVQRIVEFTETEINLKVENSIRNLKARIADLTIEHFKKDIQTQLDKQAHERIIEKNIERCGEIIEGK